MKQLRFLFIVCLVIAIVPIATLADVMPALIHNNEILVRIKPDAVNSRTVSAITQISRNVSVVEQFNAVDRDFVTVKVNSDAEYNAVLNTLKSNPAFDAVTPNLLRYTSFLPNDPLLFNGLTGTETSPPTLSYKWQYSLECISAFQYWGGINAGSENIIVAIIDSGVCYDHPDLVNQLWTNQTELNGIAGKDDDGNGYVDDIHGYDFYKNDGNPYDDEGGSSDYHGTAVAGVVGAQSNNSLGLAGVAGGRGVAGQNGVRLMCMRAGTRNITLSAEIQCIDYASKMGAHVINMSFGGETGGTPEDDACRIATERGTVVVAAGGNQGASPGVPYDYPANFDSVIGVGAVELVFSKTLPPSLALATYSKYGPGQEICAPGTKIITTGPEGLYRTDSGTSGTYTNALSGTSFASPIVAAAAGLLRSNSPSLSVSEVRNTLRLLTVDYGDVGFDEKYGYGVLDLSLGIQSKGDTNGDKTINDKDIQPIIDNFNAKVGESNYKAEIDTNSDGVIDELDLFAIGRNYGKTNI